MNSDQKTNSIIRTLSFFDLFDHPLTPIEIWQGLDLKCGLTEVEAALAHGDQAIETSQGFYFLAGRSELVGKRIRDYNLLNRKIKIALKAARRLRYLTGVKMIAVCNNFSYRPESDIDFFIIVRRDRIWLMRFFITACLFTSGMWRHRSKIKDRICLSFYVTEAGMDLENLTLGALQDRAAQAGQTGGGRVSDQNKEYRDPYFYHWMNDLMPVYGGETFAMFWQANAWLDKYLPNRQLPVMAPHFTIQDHWFVRLTRWMDDLWLNIWIGEGLEKILKSLQLKKMDRNLNSARYAGDTRVVISDMVLKFHEGDRREEYRERWEKKIKEVRGDF